MKKREDLEGRAIYGRTIPRHILVKWGERSWTEEKRLRLRRVGGLL
jgi:hypothetical protein